MEETRELLRRHGFRATHGRIILLQVLRKAGRPLTHAEILNKLRGASFNRVTLYRALEALVNAGIVHRAYLGNRSWAYETSERCAEHQCHPHFTCTACAHVACLTETNVPLAKGLPKGYLIERQKVHIEGLCPECSQMKGIQE